MRAAEKIQMEIEEEQNRGAIIFLPSAIVPESFYRPVIEKIWLTENDLYNSQGKFRVRYEGLLKLANAAGIEWSAPDSGRADNGSDKLYVAFRAVGLIRKADGKLYPTAASYDLDLELVKEELEDQYRQKAQNMKNKSTQEKEDYIRYCVSRDWLHKRKHKVTLAESGAKARVIRSILGLQSQYSNKEDITGRPFVMVRFIMDHQNPDIRQALLTAAIGNMSAIYGGGAGVPQALPKYEPIPGDDNVIDMHPEPEPELDGRVVDFEASRIEDQIKTIEQLAVRKGYNLKGFLDRAQCSLDQLLPVKRLKLFINLINMETAA